ncbi:MAG: sensor histidine kinase [Pseudomonadota bacterium]
MPEVITRGSLRLRLAGFLIATGAIMAAVLVVIFLFFARQITTEAQDSQLLASTTSILESATYENGQLVIDIPYSAFSMLGAVSDDRVFYRIQIDGTFLSGYENLPQPTASLSPQFSDGMFSDDVIRMVTAARLIGSGDEPSTLSVSVAQTNDGTNLRLRTIFMQASGFGLGFFFIATLLAVWVSKQAYAPLNNLATSIDRRGPSDLSAIRQTVPQEMASLVGALNEFSSRLKRALDRSEDFIAEAAHRIRTPLAVVRTKTDIAHKTARTKKMKDTLREVILSVDESSRTASQLLDHAMVNVRTDSLEFEPINLAQLLAEVIERFDPIAAMRDIEILHRIDTTIQTFGDRVLLNSAFSNLLDNAIKYTSIDSRVCVEAHVFAGNISVTFLDEGSGFQDQVRHQLFERFRRGEQINTTVGSGLGLTIARDVIAAHDGNINLQNGKEGGACVTVTLPLAS